MVREFIGHVSVVHHKRSRVRAIANTTEARRVISGKILSILLHATVFELLHLGAYRMTSFTEKAPKPDTGKIAIPKIILIIVLSVSSAGIAFAIGSATNDAAQRTQLEEMRQDIQKVRAMPSPDQVVTKDQLTEIVRRLDDRTVQISRDVEYLREREERRSR
jgi:hypothetical protein